MANPAGESNDEVLKLDFDRRLMLQFRGSVVTSDAGLLAYRELDDALGLSTMAGETLADARTGRNGRHALVGLLRQSVFGRLAGYEDVNDAERLRHDPAMRWIVVKKAVEQKRVSWRVRADSGALQRASRCCVVFAANFHVRSRLQRKRNSEFIFRHSSKTRTAVLNKAHHISCADK
jgi:hypothetical protein